MKKPLISIICPLYNKALYISETIESVLSQTCQKWELIIVENGSVDGSIDCVKKFVDDRIKLIISSKRGPGSARNQGIMNALGEWILFLDADDLIKPDYLANQLNFADRNPEADIIVGKWVQFNDESNAEHIKFPPGYPIVNRVLIDSAIAFTPWAPNAAIVRRAILRGDYLWPEHMDKLLAEDTPFWFKLINSFRVAYSCTCGARYRFLSEGCRTDMTPSKWFEGLNAAAEENLNFLKNRGKNLTAIQKEQLGLLFFGIYEKAVIANDSVISSIAGVKSRFWFFAAFFAGRMLKSSIFFGAIFGVNALRIIKRKNAH